MLQKCIQKHFGLKIQLTDKEIILGIPNQNNCDILDMINKVILFGKYFIYKCKLSDTEPSYGNLTHYVNKQCNLSLVN